MLRDGNGSRGNKIFIALDNSQKKLNPLSFYERDLIFDLNIREGYLHYMANRILLQDFAKKLVLIKRDSINQLMRSSLFVKYGDIYYRRAFPSKRREVKMEHRDMRSKCRRTAVPDFDGLAIHQSRDQYMNFWREWKKKDRTVGKIKKKEKVMFIILQFQKKSG
ncbi:hypothetical protein CEXT_56181 [Caerostris extrusa]|uniref:Uncharacterized protein n=1 Tax=Caerostris extrusa TaxID=172846 RepID=A0AAV4MFN8_CAEEX|nr:hypothetical protein CEXT_56181 [Caerostris extrusa]